MSSRLALGAVWVGLLLASVQCGRAKDSRPPDGKSNGAPREVGAPTTSQDPNAENPDRDRYVDLAKEPFHPEWVGGTLVLSRGDDPGPMNNLLWVKGDAHVFAKNFLFPFLLSEVPDRVDGALAYEPWVAASLPTMKDDRRTWIWTLRTDLTWSDGPPLTAHDYAFTWDLLQNPEIRCGGLRGKLERIETVKAVDDHTIEVVYKEPYYHAVVNFGLEFRVIPKHWAPKDPKLFNESRVQPSHGPYKITAYDDQKLHMELRPEYRNVSWPVFPHYVEQVEIRFIKDATANLQLLKTGAIHLSIINYDQFQTLGADEQFKKSAWRTHYALPFFYFLAWNLMDPDDRELSRPHQVLGDLRVRKALAHLIPRQRVVDDYFHGRGTLVTGPYFFMEEGYDPAVPQVTYDPAEARRLLTEAGWNLDEDGYRIKDGRRLEFTLLRAAGKLSAIDPVTTLFEQEARKVGVVVNMAPLQQSEVVKRASAHQFDALIIGFSHRPPFEPDMFEMFHGSLARGDAYNWGGLNDPEVDRLIDGYRAEMDFKKRVTLRRALHRRLAELAVHTYLYSPASTVGVSKVWANVKVHDLGIWFRDFVLRERWKR